MRRFIPHLLTTSILAAVSCAPSTHLCQDAPMLSPVQPGHQRILIGDKYDANGQLLLSVPAVIEVDRSPDQNFRCLIMSTSGAGRVFAAAINNSDAEVEVDGESVAVATGKAPKVRTNKVRASSFGTTFIVQGGKAVQRVVAWDIKPGQRPVEVVALDANGKPIPGAVVQLGNNEIAELKEGEKIFTKRKYHKGNDRVVDKLVADAVRSAVKSGFKFPEPQ